MNPPRFPMQQGMIADQTLLDRNASSLAWRRLRSRRFEPLFLADWEGALFLHFAVDAARLQPWVPFPLDCRDGSAWVSLVAFTMRDMRLRAAGAVGRRLCVPIATHAFLNVRTYVIRDGEPGIHFLAEWLTNRLAVMLGPRIFGLPYRLGTIDYRDQPFTGSVIADASAALRYHAVRRDFSLSPCPPGSLDEFLLERYTAYVSWQGGKQLGFFRVWHPPWPQARLEVEIADCSLVDRVPGGLDWGRTTRFVFANYSPGCRDVHMGRPHRLEPKIIKHGKP